MKQLIKDLMILEGSEIAFILDADAWTLAGIDVDRPVSITVEDGKLIVRNVPDEEV